jgi:regulator of nucleoside diphosphate kinase
MAQKKIILNEEHYKKLRGIIDAYKRTGKPLLPHYARLDQELTNAAVMAEEEIPENVVTIGSAVNCTYLDSGTTGRVIPVFPAFIDDHPDNISILSPLALALMGEQAGTVIEYTAPGGQFSVRIDSVTRIAAG